MGSRHRNLSRAAKKIATVGTATATVTMMTLALTPPLQANADAIETRLADSRDPALVGGSATTVLGGLDGGVLRLGLNRAGLTALAATPGTPGLPPMALAPGAPDPASIPDLTFGIGTQAYDGLQAVGAAIESFLLDNINLSGLLQALGVDPEAAVNSALGAVLTGLLTNIPVDLSGAVGGLPIIGPALAAGFTAAGIDNVAALLTLIGFDLDDPLNLAGAAAPGLNIITTGPPLSLLDFLDVDLGWVPGYPNSVADEINGTPYLDVNAVGLLTQLLTDIGTGQGTLGVRILLNTALTAIGLLPGGNLDILNLRVPVVAGFGLGAFAAGMAYPQVLAQLPYQPGGALYEGASPVAGSITVLPLILLRNPGRANGGLFARFYPLAALAGIDTVTPDAEVANSIDSNATPLLDIAGLALGGANLVPIKVDATVEYDPLSDFPAWFNPVSLANAGAAAMFPTYILRGITANGALAAITGQAEPQLAEALAGVAAGDPLALNLYLTLPTDALPLLEPIRLPVDFLNLVTGANFNNPVATALEPALKILTNLGFSDVDQDNGYERTLDQADVLTPFGTLPSTVDWGRVPGDVVAALLDGIGQAVAQGIVSPTPVDNPLRDIVGIIESLTGGGAQTATPAAALPAPEAPSLPAVLADEPAGLTAAAKKSAQAAPAADESDDPAPESTAVAVKRARGQLNHVFDRATETLDDVTTTAQDEVKNIVSGTERPERDSSDKASDGSGGAKVTRSGSRAKDSSSSDED
ncbi:MAG: PE-PPE domain-containing protein [Mycobacterium sp.]